MNAKIEKIATIAYSNKDTVYHTYNTAKELIEKGIKGCFVECGVGAGAQIAAMKVACEELNSTKTIYGFDSFDGIPLAGEYDDEQPGIGAIKHDKMLPERDRLISSGITVHSKENVLNNFAHFDLSTDNVFLIEGWFQDTLPAIRPKIFDIALLRIDGDLYESTMCCLQNLYDKVVEGGIVILDDHALAGANKAVSDYFGDNMPDIKPVDGGGGVAFFIKK
jgi:O-methyltransferase